MKVEKAPAGSSDPASKPWVRNTWYVACRSDEVAAKPLGRRICDLPMVFWRTANGDIAAVEDFCPHRGAPLSLGFLREGQLTCGYHGLVMGPDGHAAFMPCQRVTSFPAVRSYPVTERHGFIWVWPGDLAAADPARLPALPWADNPAWAFGGGMFHVQCDYRLMVDNLMDLTHETYVHPGSIGQAEIDEAPVNSSVEGDEVITSRFMNNIPPPPFWRMALGTVKPDYQGLVDRWQVCRFHLPSHVMIDVGVAIAGEGGRDAALGRKASGVVVDFITPETSTSHWYFWGLARGFAVHDSALTEKVREGQGAIFAEDRGILERQQANLSLYPNRKLLNLNIDAGGVYARRMIAKAIASEESLR